MKCHSPHPGFRQKDRERKEWIKRLIHFICILWHHCLAFQKEWKSTQSMCHLFTTEFNWTNRINKGGRNRHDVLMLPLFNLLTSWYAGVERQVHSFLTQHSTHALMRDKSVNGHCNHLCPRNSTVLVSRTTRNHYSSVRTLTSSRF